VEVANREKGQVSGLESADGDPEELVGGYVIDFKVGQSFGEPQP